MTYEEYLDEITTLIYELHDVTEDEAINLVVAAQERGYFVAHDEHAEMRTMAHAKTDAQLIHTNRNKKYSHNA